MVCLFLIWIAIGIWGNINHDKSSRETMVVLFIWSLMKISWRGDQYVVQTGWWISSLMKISGGRTSVLEQTGFSYENKAFSARFQSGNDGSKGKSSTNRVSWDFMVIEWWHHRMVIVHYVSVDTKWNKRYMEIELDLTYQTWWHWGFSLCQSNTGYPQTKRNLIAGKNIKVNGIFSSTPCLIAGE